MKSNTGERHIKRLWKVPGLKVGRLTEVEDSVQWRAVNLGEDFESITLPGFVVPVQVNLGQTLSDGRLLAGSI